MSQPHPSSEQGTWCQNYKGLLLILWFKEMGCSQQAIPAKTTPNLALLIHHYITHVFILMDQICTCYSKNKNRAGTAAGTCLPNKSKSARPFGARAWQMGKAWLSTASPFQRTADGTVKIKHACRALQFLLLLTFPCSPQSQLDPIHLLPSLSPSWLKKGLNIFPSWFSCAYHFILDTISATEGRGRVPT